MVLSRTQIRLSLFQVRLIIEIIALRRSLFQVRLHIEIMRTHIRRSLFQVRLHIEIMVSDMVGKQFPAI